MDKEHELLALKARKARILNGLPESKKLVWNEENAQTIKELCEVERRIAQLEDYICTNEQPGPVTSTWPLIWNGLVQIDDDKLTFEFVERRATSD